MTQPNWKCVYTTEIPVRWCDMDAFGHVNNSVYLSYFEVARIDWWQSITPNDIHLYDVGPVIVTANCTFLKAIVYPETVLVKLFVGPAGRSSYDCFYQIYSQQHTDVLYAEGTTKVVWVDRQLEKSIPLPDYIRHHLPEKSP